MSLPLLINASNASHPADFHYLASIAVKEGKVFALFVRSPARMFKSNEVGLRHILETFRLL